MVPVRTILKFTRDLGQRSSLYTIRKGGFLNKLRSAPLVSLSSILPFSNANCLHEESSRPIEGKSVTNVDNSHKKDSLQSFVNTSSSEVSVQRNNISRENVDLDHYEDKLGVYTTPELPQSSTLAAYVNESETLAKLVDLGVDLYRIERKERPALDFLVALDFERDIRPRLALLHELGFDTEHHVGQILSHNPHLLKVEERVLRARVSYLKVKKFTDESISAIINKSPKFLSIPIEDVDGRLGVFQRYLKLEGWQVRNLVVKYPKLVIWPDFSLINGNLILLNNKFGFSTSETQKLVLNCPKILLFGRRKMIDNFVYINHEMKLDKKFLLEAPYAFSEPLHRIKERHKFLVKIGRDQFDPSKPMYISLKRLTSVSDSVFCEEIAKVSLEEYSQFLKTI